MVVSLKANRKRIIAFLVLAAIVVGACLFLRGGTGGEEAGPEEWPGGTPEERLAFLESFGWEVDPEPAENREVMIPTEFNDIYTTYNVMQKAQGFDLRPYAGMVCTQYKYHITNYEGEPEVYATLLVYGERIIGGDVACAEAAGFMHGFAPDSARYGETAAAKGNDRKDAAKKETAKAESSSLPAEDCSSMPAEETEETVGPAAEDGEEAGAEETNAEPTAEDAYPTD